MRVYVHVSRFPTHAATHTHAVSGPCVILRHHALAVVCPCALTTKRDSLVSRLFLSLSA